MSRFRLSRKGLVLLLIGVVYVLIGSSYLNADLTFNGRLSLHLATDLMPLSRWALVWIGVGVVAVCCAPAGQRRDTLGYLLLSVLAVWWMCVYVAGWIVFGAQRSYVGALQYLLVAIVIPILAGIPEPPDRHDPTGGRR